MHLTLCPEEEARPTAHQLILLHLAVLAGTFSHCPSDQGVVGGASPWAPSREGGALISRAQMIWAPEPRQAVAVAIAHTGDAPRAPRSDTS